VQQVVSSSRISFGSAEWRKARAGPWCDGGYSTS
jgi:hypothetical protein